MSKFSNTYVPMQSLAGAKRMVTGLLARELAKIGVVIMPSMEEKLIELYLTLREANFTNKDIMLVLEGYAMRIGMRIHMAKGEDTGTIIHLAEQVQNNTMSRISVFNEMPIRRTHMSTKGKYVKYHNEKYYLCGGQNE